MDALSQRIAALKVEYPNWRSEALFEYSPREDVAAWTDEELKLFAYSDGYVKPPRRPRPMKEEKETEEEEEEVMVSAAAKAGAAPPPPPASPPPPAASSPPAPPVAATTTTTTTTTITTITSPPPATAALPTPGVGRWYFDVDAWNPDEAEWALALQQLPSDDDRAKVNRFVFEKDRKLAVGSRLLQRFCCRRVLGLRNRNRSSSGSSSSSSSDGGDPREASFVIGRTKEGKPFLDYGLGEDEDDDGSNSSSSSSHHHHHNNNAARRAALAAGLVNFNFNATHHGSVVALACEPLSAVGVDVVCDSERPHNHFVPATLRKSSNDYEDDYDRYLSAGSSSAGGSGSKATSEVESENRRAQEEFFQSFDRSFTAAEWGAIRDAALDVEERYREFYAHWALKEAYIKAHGLGFGIELRDLSFFRRTANSGGNSGCGSSRGRGSGSGAGGNNSRGSGGSSFGEWAVLVEGVEPSPPWSFTVSRLDAHHVAAVARAPPQHCHPGWAKRLLRPSLTAAECAAGAALPQQPFVALSFAQLLFPSDEFDNGGSGSNDDDDDDDDDDEGLRERLFAIRHGNDICAALDGNGGLLAMQPPPRWLARWRRWLFAPPFDGSSSMSPSSSSSFSSSPSSSSSLSSLSSRRLPPHASTPPTTHCHAAQQPQQYWTPLPRGARRDDAACVEEAKRSDAAKRRRGVGPRGQARGAASMAASNEGSTNGNGNANGNANANANDDARLLTSSGVRRSPNVFALSDLHTDHSSNLKWVESLPDRSSSFSAPSPSAAGANEPPMNVVIVAGDVSHSLTVIERTLRILKGKFDEVFYTVGNHELWVDKQTKLRHASSSSSSSASTGSGDSNASAAESSSPDSTGSGRTEGAVATTPPSCSSLDKLMDILELCDRLMVRTRPAVLAGGVVVVPMLSWYHLNFYNRNLPAACSACSPSSSSSSVTSLMLTASAKLSAHERHFDCQCVWPALVGIDGEPHFSLAPNIAPFFSSLNRMVLEESGLVCLAKQLRYEPTAPAAPATGATGATAAGGAASKTTTTPAKATTGPRVGPTGGKVRTRDPPRQPIEPPAVVSFSHFIPVSTYDNSS